MSLRRLHFEEVTSNKDRRVQASLYPPSEDRRVAASLHPSSYLDLLELIWSEAESAFTSPANEHRRVATSLYPSENPSYQATLRD